MSCWNRSRPRVRHGLGSISANSDYRRVRLCWRTAGGTFGAGWTQRGAWFAKRKGCTSMAATGFSDTSGVGRCENSGIELSWRRCDHSGSRHGTPGSNPQSCTAREAHHHRGRHHRTQRRWCRTLQHASSCGARPSASALHAVGKPPTRPASWEAEKLQAQPAVGTHKQTWHRVGRTHVNAAS